MMQANSRIVMSGLVVAAMIFSSVGIISFQVFGKTDSVSIAKIGEPSVGADKMPLAVSLADHASETPEAVHERDVAASLTSGQSNPVYRAVEKRDLEEERLASPTESNRITS